MHCLNCFMTCINSNIGGYFFVTQPPQVRGKKYPDNYTAPPHTPVKRWKKMQTLGAGALADKSYALRYKAS